MGKSLNRIEIVDNPTHPPWNPSHKHWTSWIIPPPRNLQSYKSPGIELIFPTVPCPRGSQAKNELVVITTNEQEGWPCLSPASELHSVDTLIEGTCRTGFCFYVSEYVTLNMRIEDSRTYSYLLSTTLKPGLNLLAWCKESILEYGGGGWIGIELPALQGFHFCSAVMECPSRTGRSTSWTWTPPKRLTKTINPCPTRFKGRLSHLR